MADPMCVEVARARIVAEIERLNVVLLHGTWSERMERRYEELVRQWHDAGRRWRVDYEEVE